ncbi:MAG: Cof-type HAD-IIB family hydrolase [Micrococcales bacterium]|nr:Cof-type HAD-IIB family hydrolase [Micrococcales bacterium]
MTRRAQLVALDVDGTVLRYDGTVSPQVRAALDEVRAAGLHVVLATGRSVAALVPVAHDLGLTSGYAVCSNGAITLELDGDPGGSGYRLVDVVTFDPGPALRALAVELPEALIAVEDVGVGFRVSAPFPADELAGEHTVVGFDDLAARPATRVVLRAPDSTPEEFHAIVQRVGLHEVSYAIGWSAWLDLTPGGVSKASALEQIRQRLGVEPFATVAVGDGSNDLEMLRWAARGVAMGHAPAAVRAVADQVTGPVDDDGLVPVLRSLL